MPDDDKAAQNRLKAHLDGRDAQVEILLRNVERFIRENLDDIVTRIETGDVTGSDAAVALGSLISQLDDAGLQKEIGRIRTIYATELRYLNSTFNELGVKQAFTDVDQRIVDTLIKFDTSKIQSHIDAEVEDIKSTLLRSVITPGKPDVRGLVGGRLESVTGALTTEVGTMLQAFSRSITTNKAQELGFDLFIYLGPDDKKTRPFCNKLLHKSPPIYTLDEIKAMDNGSDLPALEYAGGYNCRHQWRPISAGKAKDRGYGN